MQPIERHFESLDWATLFLCSCLILLAIARYLYPKRFDEFVMLPITNKYFLVQGRSNEIQHPFNILLFVIQIISVSLFIWMTFKVFNPEIVQQNKWLFLQIATGYSVFVLIKFLIEKIIGTIFSIEGVVNSYLYQKLSYRNLLALAVFTGNLIFFYMVEPTQMALLLFSISIVLLTSISLFYSFKTNGNLILSNLFYFILYLCALEISPYIILYKTLV